MSSSIALARSHGHHLLAIALGCALPGALLGVARVGLGGARATLAAGAWVHDPVIAALMVVQFVVVPCVSAATVLYVTRSALLALEERPATRKETLEVMRGAWIRSLVVSFFSYVGSLLAFFLCFVPGCFFVAAFLVAVPASLAEGCGVTEAFGRAAELTRGRSGGVFLAYLAFSVPILLAAFPLIAVYFVMIAQTKRHRRACRSRSSQRPFP